MVFHGYAEHIDSIGLKSTVSSGCLVQRIPEKIQSLSIQEDGSWLEFFICISKDLYQALVSMNLLDTEQNILRPGSNRALYEKCERFLQKMKQSHPSEVATLLPEALELILLFHKLHRENTYRSADLEVIKKACLLLGQTSDFSYTAKDVASDLGIGYEKFRKLFRQHMGIAPGKYLIVQRMNAAKALLSETTKPIKAIALELGFSDAYSFSKQFHTVVGMSPTEFKRQY